MSHVWKGLPALCAVVVGVLVYIGYVRLWLVLLGIGVGLLALAGGRCLMPRDPVLANVMISLFMLTAIGLMATVSAGLLWLALNLTAALPNSNVEESKAVVAALMSALTTFAGVVVTKDLEQGSGPLWPGTRFRKVVSSVFSQPRFAIGGDTKPYDAVYEDRVRGGGPSGWGLRARHARAKILKAHLGTLPR